MAKRQHAVKVSRVRSPAGDAFSGFVVRVLRLSGLFYAAGDSLARPSGQSSARWQVLAAVESEPRTVAQVARALGLARQSVQRVADLLERDGLATFEKNPSDLRADVLRLTDRGRRTLSSIQEAQRAWADELGAAIGETSLRRATEVLDRVTAALADADAESKE